MINDTELETLSSEEFDQYFDYINDRGDIWMKLYHWRNSVNGENKRHRIIQLESDLATDSRTTEEVYVETHADAVGTVKIVVDWYETTPESERLTTDKWLNKIYSKMDTS